MIYSLILIGIALTILGAIQWLIKYHERVEKGVQKRIKENTNESK